MHTIACTGRLSARVSVEIAVPPIAARNRWTLRDHTTFSWRRFSLKYVEMVNDPIRTKPSSGGHTQEYDPRVRLTFKSLARGAKIGGPFRHRTFRSAECRSLNSLRIGSNRCGNNGEGRSGFVIFAIGDWCDRGKLRMPNAHRGWRLLASPQLDQASASIRRSPMAGRPSLVRGGSHS